MTKPDYDKAHYDWLVSELELHFDNLDNVFLDLLKRLHMVNQGEPSTDYVMWELQAKANQFSKQIIKVYQILHNRLDTFDYEYRWMHINMLYIIIEIKKPAGDRDTVMWQLKQHVTHWHEHVRINVISQLKQMAINGNRRARQVLWDARTFNLLNKEETLAFRKEIYDALNEIDKN